jgi:hypothetical protein
MPPDADGAGAGSDRLAVILSLVDATDFERVDPPDGLWGRIAASIAAEPDSTPAGSGTVVEYAIDADDVVVPVGDEWSRFARQNDAPELDELAPDRTLWSYFGSDEVRDVWRLLIEQVRATRTPAQVPLRCDAPQLRRWFEMTITPEPGGVVRFRSALTFEESRPAVALLDDDVELRSDRPAVPVCSWCGEGHDGSRWRRIEDVVRDLRLLEDLMPAVDYGICPTCRELMASQLFTSRAQKGTVEDPPGR